MAVTRENQLELFELTTPPTTRLHRELWGRVSMQLRHDQLLMVGVSSLIALAVIFGCGVERGKELARAEYSLLARQQPVSPNSELVAHLATRSVPQAQPVTTNIARENSPRPAAFQRVTPDQPTRAVSDGRTRYIIQLVTYSQPQLAKQELKRLQARGERAFLMLNGGRAVVNVGPFPSRDNASKKLAALKTRYQDCFLRSL